MSGSEVTQYQNCFVLNFGWSEEISLPQLILSLEDDEALDISMNVRRNAPSNCQIVLIGSKNLKKLHLIMKKVELLTGGLARRPSIYITEKTNEVVNSDEKLMVNC